MSSFARTLSHFTNKKSIMNNSESVTKLRQLYQETSKHSNYQVLAPALRDLMGDSELDICSRHEAERMQFICSHVDFKNATVFDIGGNTGYFSFEALAHGASRVDYYEGNGAHAKFVGQAANALGYGDRLNAHESYLEFSGNSFPLASDVGLLLNVLHHVGDDYGDSKLDVEAARAQIITSLNRMSAYADTLVFQLGFCWKGNRETLLFENGTKSEMIEFIQTGIDGTWEIAAIGIAQKNSDGVTYHSPNPENLKRDDNMGEFLNRPLFILKSNRSERQPFSPTNSIQSPL